MWVNEPTVVLEVRNCSKCLQDFRTANGRVSVCDKCRKPKKKWPARGWVESFRGTELAPRERQVIDLLAAGKIYKEIAHVLHLSEGTLKVYCSQIFRKMKMTRDELIIWRITGRLPGEPLVEPWPELPERRAA